MTYATRHPEDVKATLRKRFQSLNNFERINGLPVDSISDLLRGRISARVAKAVDKALVADAVKLPSPSKPTDISDNNGHSRRAHRLNRVAA